MRSLYGGVSVSALGAVVAACCLTSALAARQGTTPAQSAEFFETRIRPILAANCFDCHTEDEKGGLRLDSREAILAGGESGPAIVAGKPDDSLLIQAVRQVAGAPKMPKGRPKLKPEDIDALVEWVRAGAPWPASRSRDAAGAAAATRWPSRPTIARSGRFSRSRRRRLRPCVTPAWAEDRHRSLHPGAAREGRPARRSRPPTSSR